MKSKSSKALMVSLALHLIAVAIGIFFWITPESRVDRGAVDAILMNVEKPKTKRITRTRRAVVQKQATTTQANQPNLKILTSNAPATNRGVVSAQDPTPFNTSASLSLGDGIGLTTSAVQIDEGPGEIARVVEGPIRQAPVQTGRPKSRLVKFIERQEGPQRIIYCVDISSSMLNLSPRKLKKVTEIMQDSLAFLEPHDQFNVMKFTDKIEFFRPDFMDVNDVNISQATVYLDTVKAEKSRSYTDRDMLEALIDSQKRKPTIIVLFSDGILTSGVPDLNKIHQHASGGARIFTMGIEMAEDYPGAKLLGLAADSSRGEFWLVE